MAIFGKGPCQKVVKLPLYCHNFWNTCPKWIKIVFLDSSCPVLSKNINFIWFLGGPKFDLMTSLWRHLDNLHKFLYSFEKTIKSYWSMPNFKSISFKMAVLQGGGQNLPSPCVCYPKDPMWNSVNWNLMHAGCYLYFLIGNLIQNVYNGNFFNVSNEINVTNVRN